MSERIAQTISGICQRLNESSFQTVPGKTSAGGIVISSSVGLDSTNFPEDVRTIQDALNRLSPEQGKPNPLLRVDGICGPKTEKAIQQFQLKQFGWSGADGKINPGGQTITRLNELVGNGGNRPLDAKKGFPQVGDEQADELYKKILTTHLERARKWIYAAQANLDIALRYVDQPDTKGHFQVFGRKERMRLANRYFRVDDFPASRRRYVLSQVRYVFATMLQVYQRPGGLWGEKAFELDSTGVAFNESRWATAHTNAGGFFRMGKDSQHQRGQRADSIYIVRENIAYYSNLDKGTKTIVHELAHFCGDYRRGWNIVDFGAYGEPEKPRVARLTPWQRIQHADSYARFARAAGS